VSKQVNRICYDRQKVRSWFCEEIWFRSLKRAGIVPDDIGTKWFLAAGKRLRPILAAGIYSSLGGCDDDVAIPIALGVECFHKASLIHDDIEDGDTMRYDQPSVHAEHGVPLAINAGDWLLGAGYALISSAALPGAVCAELVRLAAWGHAELARGQGDELAFCFHPHPIALEKTIEIYERKTSAAFNVALQCGAVAAGMKPEKRAILARFARAWGIAFQIRDDEEDVVSIKGRTSDLCALRPTAYLAMACRSRSSDLCKALAEAWNGGDKERRRLGRAIAGSAIPGRVAKLGLEYEAAAEFYLSKLPAGPRKMIKGLLSKP
jgi:geranylgeranyl pyrophosphate synthase